VHTGKIRTIIRARRFEEEMALIEPDVQRADEFLEGTETILSRQPWSGYQLDESRVWFIPGLRVDLALYYAFDENNVYFLSIKKIVPPEF
jgi:hypothetical protein